MQINAQAVIDKLTNNFAAELAGVKRDLVVSEIQIETLSAEVENLSAELEMLRKQATESSDSVEGEVIG